MEIVNAIKLVMEIGIRVVEAVRNGREDIPLSEILPDEYADEIALLRAEAEAREMYGDN